MRIGGFVGKYSSVMAGDANNAEAAKISRFITCSRAACWEATWKQISFLCAVHVIEKSIFEAKVLRRSSNAKNSLVTAIEV